MDESWEKWFSNLVSNNTTFTALQSRNQTSYVIISFGSYENDSPFCRKWVMMSFMCSMNTTWWYLLRKNWWRERVQCLMIQILLSTTTMALVRVWKQTHNMRILARRRTKYFHPALSLLQTPLWFQMLLMNRSMQKLRREEAIYRRNST